ncbi:MAG: hypothetical protein VR68_03280 [Peptococcaceae bacterium BRH_c4a]|nr:MAG: hypothetical protein VR68_03280 [Peptococcaceae bacterium BRH_c4a]
MRTIQPERNYLTRLLSSAIDGMQPQNPPENLDWGKLYALATHHSVSNMACYGIEKLDSAGKPPQEVLMKFQSDQKKAVAKEATQHITVEQVLKTFEENRIACMPLKGYLIKYLYPKPDMRLMADVDILFKDEQTEQMEKLLLGLGFVLEHKGGKHDNYFKTPFIKLEMHRMLMPEDSPSSDYFNKVWDRAGLKAGCQYTYQLSHEDFFVYIMMHLTKHYANGGTGIRSIMDIWLYNTRYRSEMDWDYIETELEKIKLREFAENILGLGEVWFGNADSNALYDEMTDFIFCSGVYGTKRNAAASSMNTYAGKNIPFWLMKLRYYLKLFFPGPEHMKILYPFLGKLSFLMPVCWVLRGGKCLLFKCEHTFQVINNVRSISEKDVVRIRNLHEKAGLLK